MRRLFLLLAIVLVALPVLNACGAEPTPGFAPRPGPAVGRPAPELEWTVGGVSDKLSDHRGEVALIVFWLPTCPHCMGELPILQSLYNRYQGDLLIVALTPDPEGERVKEELDLTFPVVIDAQGQYAGIYQILYVPTMFIVDRGGIIRVRQEGALSRPDLEKILEPLLEEK